MINLPSYVYLQNESYKFQSLDLHRYILIINGHGNYSIIYKSLVLCYLMDSICKN